MSRKAAALALVGWLVLAGAAVSGASARGDVAETVREARALLDGGRADEAVALLEALREEHPQEVLPLLAYALFDARDDLPGAAERLAEYLEIVPRDEWALDLLAVVAGRALDRGDPGLARTCAKVLMLKEPDEKEHRYLWAEASYRLGRRDSVQEATRALIRDFPSFESAYWLLAKVLEDEGRYEEAVAVYRELLRESSGNVAARITRGSLLLWQVRDGEAAHQEFRSAAEIAGAGTPEREEALAGVRLAEEAIARTRRLAARYAFLQIALVAVLGGWVALLAGAWLLLARVAPRGE